MTPENIKTRQVKDTAGFTLIELSIVLVIIGLIIGGILTGQDLIRAAEQRATIAQIEKYNTAVRTFRGKYGSMPGDFLASKAYSFGLYTYAPGTVACSQGCANENGILESPGGVSIGDEVLIFWRQLSDANLIDGTYAQDGATAGTIPVDTTLVTFVGPSANTTGSAVGLLLPAAKLGNGNFVFPLYAGNKGSHYYLIGDFYTATIFPGGGGYTGPTNNIAPQVVYNIDKKVDDGLPGGGSVMAIDSTAINFLIINGQGFWNLVVSPQANCVNGTSYNLSTNIPACSLAMRFN